MMRQLAIYMAEIAKKANFSGKTIRLSARFGPWRTFAEMLGKALTIFPLQSWLDWDRWLFLKLNREWTNSFFDLILPYLRNAFFWAPLYIFVLVFVGMNFGKKGWWWCLGLLASVAVADLIGARVFKENIERLRPCQDPSFLPYVRLLLKQCSGSYSFVSNHAANHFAIATYLVMTFRGIFRHWMYLAYVWAALVAYAQVYVGVHYPTDVLGGALLGMLAGLLSATIIKKKAGSFTLAKQ
jgi:membrane-associated phospholipid phosphatase